MKKTMGVFFIMVVSLFLISAVGKADNYIPEIKLLVSSDGTYWVTDTRNLEEGKSYYLMVQASVRVPGLRLQLFGADEILCTLAFPQDQIMNINVTDSDVLWDFSELTYQAQAADSGGAEAAAGALGGADAAAAGAVSIITASPVPIIIYVSGELIKKKAKARKEMLDSLHEKKIENFLVSEEHSNQFNLYSFFMPTSPLSDRDFSSGVKPRNVSMIFKIDAQTKGSQKIKIFYERRVSEIYMQEYTLVVN